MVAIIGGPKTGKTTLAGTMEPDEKSIRHSDDVSHLGWSKASEEVSEWFDDKDCKVIEGVAVVRALRKWLKRNPTGRPVDEIIFLTDPVVEQSERQAAMSKGCESVWNEIEFQLIGRGVRIIYNMTLDI